MRPSLILLIMIIILSACAPVQASPTEVEMPAATPVPEFRIVGYATAAVIVDTVQFDRLTHINYAFLIPVPDETANINAVVKPFQWPVCAVGSILF